jgi:hypothetical protein
MRAFASSTHGLQIVMDLVSRSGGLFPGQTHGRERTTAINKELAQPTPFQLPILLIGFGAFSAAKSTVSNEAEGAAALEAPFHDDSPPGAR